MLDKVKSILANRQNGSRALVEEILETIMATNPSKAELQALVSELKKSEPAMVALHHLARVLNRAVRVVDGRTFVHHYRLRWQHADRQIARHLLPLLPTSPSHLTFLTHSHSRTVINVLVELQQKGRVNQVIQTRSEPGGEGALQARELSKAGLSVMLIADADIAGHLAKVNACLLGADQWSAEAFLNKTGSARIVELAGSRHIPVFVLADTRKQMTTLQTKGINRNLFEKVKKAPHVRYINEKGVI